MPARALVRTNAPGEPDDPGGEPGGGCSRNREDVRRRTGSADAATRLNRRSEVNRPVEQRQRAGLSPFEHSLQVYAPYGRKDFVCQLRATTNLTPFQW
jgi:hypothetical protein